MPRDAYLKSTPHTLGVNPTVFSRSNSRTEVLIRYEKIRNEIRYEKIR